MKLGIALSGGGIRGIAHAGVLKALEENNIKIDVMAGTSSGSLITVLYAMGFSPYYIYVLFKRYAKLIVGLETKPIISGISGFVANKKVGISGLKTGQSLEESFNEIALKKGFKNISDIKMPISIPAVDIRNSKEYIFTSKKFANKGMDKRYLNNISIGKAIRASSSFPGYFQPFKHKESLFLDGGLLNNVPVDEAKELGADKVIAVKFVSDAVQEDSGMMDVVMRCIDIMGDRISENGLKMSDYILNVGTDKTGLFDVDKLDMCYKSGYDCTMKHIDEIKKIIN